MRKGLLCVFVLWGCLSAHPEELEAPWQELKTLYQEKVAREVREQLLPEATTEFRYTVDAASYALQVSEEIVQGTVEISGKVLSGRPAPINFFGADTVLGEVLSVSGGALLPGVGEASTAFLPEAGSAFSLSTEILQSPRQDEGARVLSMRIPPALRNEVLLNLPEGAKLLQFPGIQDAEGRIHFAATEQFEIRYLLKSSLEKATPEMKLLTRIALQEKRLLLGTWLWPARNSLEPCTLVAPAGAILIGSSFKSSEFTSLGSDRYEIAGDLAMTEPALVEFAVPLGDNAGETPVLLPAVEHNAGGQGRFFLEQPENGEVAVSGEGLLRQLPVKGLEEPLRARAGGVTHFMSLPVANSLNLSFRPYESSGASAPVLAAQSLFVAFDESGNALSTLVLEIPAGFGPRVGIEAVPGAEVWSLHVNKEQRQVYRDAAGLWIVALDTQAASLVQLSYLQTGPKLALQGELKITLPKTNLASQVLNVGIALPERVELIFVDGPINPAAAPPASPPEGFAGRPHFFTQSFYKGEGMSIALSYKEPVSKRPAPQGEVQ